MKGFLDFYRSFFGQVSTRVNPWVAVNSIGIVWTFGAFFCEIFTVPVGWHRWNTRRAQAWPRPAVLQPPRRH